MPSYGAEVWPLDADTTSIERIHWFALKRLLNTSLRTPNVIVYGETGRYPLFVNIYLKCIQFRLLILNMSPHRLQFKAYTMLLHLHEQNKNTWASSVCYVLYKCDCNEVWVNQSVWKCEGISERVQLKGPFFVQIRLGKQFKNQRKLFCLLHLSVVIVLNGIPERIKAC